MKEVEEANYMWSSESQPDEQKGGFKKQRQCYATLLAPTRFTILLGQGEAAVRQASSHGRARRVPDSRDPRFCRLERGRLTGFVSRMRKPGRNFVRPARRYARSRKRRAAI